MQVRFKGQQDLGNKLREQAALVPLTAWCRTTICNRCWKLPPYQSCVSVRQGPAHSCLAQRAGVTCLTKYMHMLCAWLQAAGVCHCVQQGPSSAATGHCAALRCAICNCCIPAVSLHAAGCRRLRLCPARTCSLLSRQASLAWRQGRWGSPSGDTGEYILAILVADASLAPLSSMCCGEVHWLAGLGEAGQPGMQAGEVGRPLQGQVAQYS
jgi:hypothetical protein